MSVADPSFLGTGWTFPPTFTRAGHTVLMASDDTDIRQSLRVLFGTAPGERVMLPEYGCALWRMVFGSLTNRLWVETDDDHLWLVNHDRTPTLHDEWHDQFGTPVREAARERLVVADGTLRLEPAQAGA